MTPTPCHPDVTTVILAGGVSSRMGEPKTHLTLPDGSRMIDRMASIARTVSSRVLVAGPPDTLPGCPHLEDDGEGPVGGVLAALTAGGPGRYLVLPCDMPALRTDLLSRLVHGLGTHQACQVQRHAHHPPPVLPLCLDGGAESMIRRTLERGRRSIQAMLEPLDVALLDWSSEDYDQFININEPEDWSRFLDRFRS